MPARSAPLLIVEAHADVRTALQMALEALDYEVHATRDVSEALEALEQLGRPGLVLLDDSVPEAERARLLPRLGQGVAPGPVPLVLLSLDAEVHCEGVQAVLRKPFSLDRLYAVVKAHCEVREVPRTRRLSGPTLVHSVPTRRLGSSLG